MSVGCFFQMEIQIFWWCTTMHALARAGSVVGAEAGWRAPPPCRPQAVVVRKMRRGMRRKHARYAPTPQPPPPDPLWIRAHFHFRGAGGLDSLMTGMSSSSAMCSKSLKPSMSGMCTSESTMSKSSLRSRRVFSASAPREKVVTALLSRERVAGQQAGRSRVAVASAGRVRRAPGGSETAPYIFEIRECTVSARSRQRYGRS